MIENLINNDLINDILTALSENKEYSFDKDGLKINASNKDGNLHFSCSYVDDGSKESKKSCQENRDRFYEYCQTIDSDLFVEVCESLDLKTVTEMIESDDKLDEGINIFMETLQEVATRKVRNITNEISKLEETLRGLINEKNTYMKYID